MTLLYAILGSLAFIGSVFALAYLIKRYLGAPIGTTLLIMVIGTVSIFLIMFGRLEKFTIGSTTIALKDFAESSVENTFGDRIRSRIAFTPDKLGSEAMLPPGAKSIIIMPGSWPIYKNLYKALLETSTKTSEPLLLVFLRSDRSVVTYFTASELFRITRWEVSPDLSSVKAGSMIDDILSEPIAKLPREWIKEPLQASTDNIEALRFLSKNNLEAAAVVDENGKYLGVIYEQDIIENLLIKLMEIK